ncbi:MAG: hypothetical protein RL033_1564 [Pseudomonadota bacterium]
MPAGLSVCSARPCCRHILSSASELSSSLFAQWSSLAAPALCSAKVCCSTAGVSTGARCVRIIKRVSWASASRQALSSKEHALGALSHATHPSARTKSAGQQRPSAAARAREEIHLPVSRRAMASKIVLLLHSCAGPGCARSSRLDGPWPRMSRTGVKSLCAVSMVMGGPACRSPSVEQGTCRPVAPAHTGHRPSAPGRSLNCHARLARSCVVAPTGPTSGDRQAWAGAVPRDGLSADSGELRGLSC